MPDTRGVMGKTADAVPGHTVDEKTGKRVQTDRFWLRQETAAGDADNEGEAQPRP